MLGEGLRLDAFSSLVKEQQHKESIVPKEPGFFPNRETQMPDS